MYNKTKQKRDGFAFGKDDFLGKDMMWYLDQLPYGILVSGGTGSGKTNRVFLRLLVRLLQLRLSQGKENCWGGLFLDPKLSFAARLIGLIKYAGLEDELYVLSENEAVTINPLKSGLSGQKVAQFIVKSLVAGKPVTMSGGAVYYESRAQALLGHLITVAMEAKRPSLRLVAEMADALTWGGTLSSAQPKAAEALKRIEVFARSDEGEKKKVLDSVQNYLEPFRCDPWRAIFFEPGPFTLDTIRDAGKLMVAAFSPNKTNNLSSGLFLLKQLFYATVIDRLTADFAGNKERLCLYFIDEFASVASGIAMVNF
jgi:hypothetical protein